MAWRDLDVMVLGGPEFSPHDVIALLGRAVDLPGVTGFDYVDERGDRSPPASSATSGTTSRWLSVSGGSTCRSGCTTTTAT